MKQILIEYAIKIAFLILLSIVTVYGRKYIKKLMLNEDAKNVVLCMKEYGHTLGINSETKWTTALDSMKNLGYDVKSDEVVAAIKAAVTELRDATGST